MTKTQLKFISKNKFIKNTFIFTIILFLIDILTKYFFTNKSYFENSLFFIKYSQNYGSALSMFSNISYYNTIVILLSFGVLYYLFKNLKEFNHTKLTCLTFYFLIPGILGNLYDRLFFGFVRDFIGIKNLFIFNMADIYLTFVVILYIIYELKQSSFFSR